MMFESMHAAGNSFSLTGGELAALASLLSPHRHVQLAGREGALQDDLLFTGKGERHKCALSLLFGFGIDRLFGRYA